MNERTQNFLALLNKGVAKTGKSWPLQCHQRSHTLLFVYVLAAEHIEIEAFLQAMEKVQPVPEDTRMAMVKLSDQLLGQPIDLEWGKVTECSWSKDDVIAALELL